MFEKIIKKILHIFNKICKIIFIIFGVLIVFGIILLIIFLFLLSTVNIHEDQRPFEERYDENLLVDNFSHYKEPIYSCLFFCIVYSEFYYENATERFENNTNYQKVTDDNFPLLNELFERFSNFEQYKDVLSFKYKEQLKKDDLYFLDYSKNKREEIYEFKIYYYDREKETLYYFYYFD